MKVSSAAVGIVGSLLIRHCVAKKYYNHRLATDTTGLWGPNPSHTYERPGDDDKEGEDRSLRGYRRAVGDPPMPDARNDDHWIGDEPDNEFFDDDSQFYVAEDLDFFRNGIDPEFFEWVNPDEIAAGEYTCGFMKPRLGSLVAVTYPRVEVYVCVRFANIQPATKGNLFAHCGGPGTLSDCVLTIENGVKKLSPEAFDSYNMWSIDQRGLGRSWPSFIHEECSDDEFVRNANGEIIEVTPRDSALYYFSVNNATSIVASLQSAKDRIRRCWTCTTCDFNLQAKQPDGNITEFHFLEYSGTRQLAEDILRLTILINAPRMHVYGISYGTTVLATLATMFPNEVGLFVLDSCSSAVAEQYHQALTMAQGTNDRIDYIIYSCEARNIQNPGSCPVNDMLKCISDINMAIEDTFGFQSGDFSQGVSYFVYVMFSNFGRAQELCNVAAEGNATRLYAVAEGFTTLSAFTYAKRRQGDDNYNPESKPSSPAFVYGNPDYPDMVGDIPIRMIQAMDKAGLIYDQDRFAREVVEVNEKYPGAGTGEPARRFHYEYMNGFYWPKAIPLPPLGNPFITGIIIGILYDPYTPYKWAQEMRTGFSSTHLLTSQAVKHGLGASDPDCQRHVTKYFDTGVMPFTDGQVCGSDFASNQDIASVFGAWGY